MPARNAKNPFFPCILLGLGLALATPQDSLYEKALDAEGAGDVATAIHLFEMANSYPGNYNAEIQEILTEYYEALQIGRDSVAIFFGTARPAFAFRREASLKSRGKKAFRWK